MPESARPQDTPQSGAAADGPGARRRRWPWVLLSGFLVLLLAAVGLFAAAAWTFSNKIYDQALMAEPYDPASLQTGELTAVRLDGRTGTGSVTTAPDAQFAADSTYTDAVVGLSVGDSLIVAGPVSSAEGAEQVRPVLSLTGPRPRPGQRYGLARDVWLRPSQAGLPKRDVKVVDDQGRTFPAWRIDGPRRQAWAVLVHGKGAARSEMLRMAQVLHALGWSSLVISYQGDRGAPPAVAGQVHYGQTEWSDVAAAVRWVTEQGADKVLLAGASHGGAVTLGFLRNAPEAARVDAVVLDSPVADFTDLIHYQARTEQLPVLGTSVPPALESAALAATALRYDLDLDAIDYTAQPEIIDVPILVLQGAADTTVYPQVNRAFKSALGDRMVYLEFPGAAHVASWNADPARYATEVAGFLRGAGLD